MNFYRVLEAAADDNLARSRWLNQRLVDKIEGLRPLVIIIDKISTGNGKSVKSKQAKMSSQWNESGAMLGGWAENSKDHRYLEADGEA